VFISMFPFISTAWNRVNDYVSWIYLYFPSAGLALMFGGLTDEVWIRAGRRVRIVTPILLVLLGCYYCYRQVLINGTSRSAISYWKRVMHLNPDSERAALKLGKAYLRRGEDARALRLLFSPPVKDMHVPCIAMSRYYCEVGDLLASAIHLRMAGHRGTGLQFQDYEMAESRLLYTAGAPDYADADLGSVLMANPYNTDAMKLLARVWLLKGYVAAASRWIDRALEISPSDSEAVRLRRRVEELRGGSSIPDTSCVIKPPAPDWLRYTIGGLRSKRIRDAIMELSERRCGDPMVQTEAAICLAREGRYDDALSKLRFAAQSLPSYAYIWAIKCWVEAESGAYEEAIASGERALELNPKSSMACNALGILYSTLADRTPAGKPEGKRYLHMALKYYRRAYQLKPGDATIRCNLGNLLQRMGKLDEAIAHFRQAIKSRPDLAEAYSSLGAALIRKGELGEAVKQYQHALQIRPDFAEAHSNLGIALAGQGRLDEAIDHFRHALRIRPDLARARRNLDMALALRRKLYKVIDPAEYRRLISGGPESAEACCRLGDAYRRAGMLMNALASYRRAAEIQPDLAMAHARLGEIYQQMGKLDRALDHYREAVRIDPHLKAVYNNLGVVYSLKGEYKRAIASYRKAIEIDPHFAKAHGGLASAYERAGNLEDLRRSRDRPPPSGR